MIEINNFGSKYVNGPTNNTAPEAHLTGQFSLEEQILNIHNFLIYRGGTQKPAVSKIERKHLVEKVKDYKE
jgi:hypothetical protein